MAREWNPGELTTSGYPYIVKRQVRGQPLSNAVEVFRGTAQDGGYGVSPATLVDGSGNRAVLIVRPVSTFEVETYLVRPGGVVRLAVPLKANVTEMVDGQIIVQLSEAWHDGATGIAAGALASFDAAGAAAHPDHLAPVTVLAPGPRESVSSAAATRDHLIVVVYHNVRGRVFDFSRNGGSWTGRPLPLPDNLSTRIVSDDPGGDAALLATDGFLTPNSVALADVRTGTLATIKSLPAKFDASRDTVEQFEATSSDGTQIPYFVVHPRSMARNGANPTILYAYGGFEISETPSYSATIGKLWLERGGVYVLANIRGGGEFGPAWHEAGLKTHRQLIYDDFAAVGA